MLFQTGSMTELQIVVGFCFILLLKAATFQDSRATSCGQRLVSQQPLIYNGSETIGGEWPWHAAIFLQNVPSGLEAYRCGGTLISSRLVLTAAHCTFQNVIPLSHNTLFVKLGLVNLHHPGKQSSKYGLIEIVRHGDFQLSTFRNDIALLRTSREVLFSYYIQPICLPSGKSNDATSVGYVVGWGFGKGDTINTLLQQTKLPIVDDVKCLRSNIQHLSLLLAEDGSNFCAGGGSMTNVCEGDSGGGLFFKSGQAWYIKGIVSAAAVSESSDNPRCDITQYVTFTNTSHFHDWISTIRDAKKNNLFGLADCGTDDHDISVLEEDKPVFLQYPWVTVLEFQIQNISKDMCSGALIHPRFVLTAGHCVCESCKSVHLKSVRLGDYNLLTNPDTEELFDDQHSIYTESITVEKVIRHPNFNAPKYGHDIALLKLIRPAKTNNVKPICLPLIEDYNYNFVTSGWKRAGVKSSILQREIGRLLDMAKCQKTYDMIKIDLIPKNSMFCVDSSDSSDGCFNFMSGTPLQYVKSADGANRYYLKGLYAFGSHRCLQNFFDVYVSVNFYLRWIKQVVDSEKK